MQALILFAHGARDSRWAEPFLRLQALTQASLPAVRVELAFLELMQPSLPDLVAQLSALAYQSITVVPVFLGQGGHVLRDLPVLETQLRAAHPNLEFKFSRAAGEDAAVLAALSQYCVGQLGVCRT